MSEPRTVFFISDGTGITAETLGNTLLTQFDGVEFRKSTLPFINTLEKANATVEYINHVAQQGNSKPLVFSTTVSDEIRDPAGRIEALELRLDSGERVWIDNSDIRYNRADGILMTNLDRRDLRSMADERP